MIPFNVIHPNGPRVPILLSIPHVGIRFPDDIKNEFDTNLTSRPDDTDWYVDRLYNFAGECGITIISSVFHRWVIDLNRAPDDKPLYNDGRIITGLCPATDFLGHPLYVDGRSEVEAVEVRRRLDLYYYPYHDQLMKLLADIKQEFGKVLLWECHSIRQYVPTIYAENFPDLILGDSDGASAGPNLIKIAYDALSSSKYGLSHNYPFKGGHITREYGQPLHGQHALQLEMSKINYMDDRELDYDEDRANAMRNTLKLTLSLLADHLLQKI